jgi:hypothetical protein
MKVYMYQMHNSESWPHFWTLTSLCGQKNLHPNPVSDQKPNPLNNKVVILEVHQVTKICQHSFLFFIHLELIESCSNNAQKSP